MPPVDNNQPTQAPAPQAPKQPGFWAKLFGKKAAPAVPVAQPTSLTPEPQLDNPAPQDFGSAPAPAVGNDVTPPPATDSVTGAPQVEVSSAPDADGTTTAPEVAVPPVLTTNPGEETPTVPAADPVQSPQFEQPAPQQPPVQQPPQSPTPPQQ